MASPAHATHDGGGNFLINKVMTDSVSGLLPTLTLAKVELGPFGGPSIVQRVDTGIETTRQNRATEAFVSRRKKPSR
jgi:hypothetical protein